MRLLNNLSPSNNLLVVSMVLLFAANVSFGQQARRTFALSTSSDTVLLDSFSILEENFELTGMDSGSYVLLEPEGKLVFLGERASRPDSVTVTFLPLPFNFSTPVQNKDRSLLFSGSVPDRDPFKYTAQQSNSNLLGLNGLEKRGSFSRGITVGNNQNLAVNSALNMQISGPLNERFQVAAAIADADIPIQPDGNTQQLQDFDQVYIQVYDDQTRITAGDFQVVSPGSYFMQYNKRLQGARVEHKMLVNDSARLAVDASAAVSRGKFNRQIIQGQEGNQGPYRLVGGENERFIIVLSGTERVYIDGKLLLRGQENDYIIDYNTSEVTFTAKNLITKDRRIVVEFQYSDRNYARSLVGVNSSYESKEWGFTLGLYSEQDAKNQPLQQELSDEQKEVLRAIGDDLQKAVVPSIDSVGPLEGQLLYAKIDTTYFDALSQDSVTTTIYRYSNNPEIAVYRLAFSEVGPANGDYVLDQILGTGRTFRWVPRVGGQPAGSFAPVVLLVTPKRRQMLVAKGRYSPSDQLEVALEVAGTNYDVNTFSGFDNQDNSGFGIKLSAKGEQPLSDSEVTLLGKADYEFVHRQFKEIERFRPVEFDRDWNIRGVNIDEDQHITSAGTGIKFRDRATLGYTLQNFDAGDAFTGFQHEAIINTNLDHLKTDFRATLSILDGQKVTSDFYQHNTLLQTPTKFFVFGYRDDFEKNKLYDPLGDSLSNSAYQFWEWEVYLANSDTAANQYKVSYNQRRDWAMRNQQLLEATYAETYGYQMRLRSKSNNQVNAIVNYRTLQITDSRLSNLKPENTLLGRLEYQFRLWRGALSSVSFYELGSGLENRREFIYIETTPGQGLYFHNDYNENGERELNEFEEAVLADQVASANYLKVFVPTDEYIKALSNQFSQTLTIRPAAIWRNEAGLKKLISRFSDVFAYNLKRKTNEIKGLDRFNPFLFEFADTVLQSISSNLRNTFYFNQSDPTFGADINLQLVNSKNLLTTGFESRASQRYGIGLRWNITPEIGIENQAGIGEKHTTSDAGALISRNFDIAFREVEPRLTFQPGTIWRLAVHYKFRDQQNQLGTGESIGGDEYSQQQTIGTEFNFNSPNKGSLLLNFNLIRMRYDGPVNSSVAFEMLEGLQPGTNATWGVSYLRTLANNLQLSINYNGRQSPGIRMIHTGGVEARAFF